MFNIRCRNVLGVVAFVLSVAFSGYAQQTPSSPWGPPARMVRMDSSAWQVLPSTNVTAQHVIDWIDAMFANTQFVMRTAFSNLLWQYGSAMFLPNNSYTVSNWLYNSIFQLFPKFDTAFDDELTTGIILTNSSYAWGLQIDAAENTFRFYIPSDLASPEAIANLIRTTAYSLVLNVVTTYVRTNSFTAPPPEPPRTGPWFEPGLVFFGRSQVYEAGKKYGDLNNRIFMYPAFGSEKAGWLADLPNPNSFTFKTNGTYTVKFVGVRDTSQGGTGLGDGHPETWTLQILLNNNIASWVAYEFNHGKPVILFQEVVYSFTITANSENTVTPRFMVDACCGTYDFVRARYHIEITFTPPR